MGRGGRGRRLNRWSPISDFVEAGEEDARRRQRQLAAEESEPEPEQSSGGGNWERFQGREAKVDRSGGMVNIYYGGALKPDGTGHGHVKATGGPMGENIVYWRLPANEGGQEIVSNSWDTLHGNDLREYLN